MALMRSASMVYVLRAKDEFYQYPSATTANLLPSNAASRLTRSTKSPNLVNMHRSRSQSSIADATLLPKGFLMRATLFFAFLLAYASVSHAALGGLPEQFNAQDTVTVSHVTSAGSSYITRDTTLATGTQVSEYVAADGVVFAVTWEGPILPDLKALLGKYFDTMVAESAKAPRAGRSQMAIDRPEVVINSGGHMRAFKGSAWIPVAFPAGFTAVDVH